MRKRKPRYYSPKDKYEVPNKKSLDWLLALSIVCPLLAITIATFIFSSMLNLSGLSVCVAILSAFIGSIIFLTIGIVSSGSDMTDIIVPSIIMIVLSLMLWPVFVRAKANAQRQKERQMLIQKVPIKRDKR